MQSSEQQFSFFVGFSSLHYNLCCFIFYFTISYAHATQFLLKMFSWPKSLFRFSLPCDRNIRTIILSNTILYLPFPSETMTLCFQALLFKRRTISELEGHLESVLVELHAAQLLNSVGRLWACFSLPSLSFCICKMGMLTAFHSLLSVLLHFLASPGYFQFLFSLNLDSPHHLILTYADIFQVLIHLFLIPF